MGKKTRERAAKAYEDTMKEEAAALGMNPEEYMMPQLPDPNTVYLIPTIEATEGWKRFFTIWPNYINANKTLEQGRKVSKSKCCPEPGLGDISEVLEYYNIPHAVEPFRRYPRDPFVHGRIKYQLFTAAGRPHHPNITSRNILFEKMGEMIPQLPNRQIRLKAEAAAVAAAQSPPPKDAGGKKKGKKKGKR